MQKVVINLNDSNMSGTTDIEVTLQDPWSGARDQWCRDLADWFATNPPIDNPGTVTIHDIVVMDDSRQVTPNP